MSSVSMLGARDTSRATAAPLVIEGVRCCRRGGDDDDDDDDDGVGAAAPAPTKRTASSWPTLRLMVALE